MLKDLLKEGGLYTLANLLTKGVSLMLIPFYTSYFTTEDYGVIDVISVFGALLTTILSLQLNQGMGRYVGENFNDSKLKKQYASTSVLIVVLIYIVSGFLLINFPGFFIELISTEETKISLYTFKLSIYAVLLSAIFYFLGVYMRFLRKVKLFSILSFLFALFNILGMLYFILILDAGINGIYLGSIVVSPIAIVLSLYLLRSDLMFYFGKKEFSQIFKFSAPLIPASIAYLLMNTIDRWYIKDLLSFDEAGVYGIAFKFSSIITIILTGFTMAMNPITFQSHEDKAFKTELAKMLKYFIGIGSFGLLILSIFSLETILVFTNSNYLEASKIMPILYFTVLITGLGMFSPGINIAKKTNVGALIIIISSMINIVLNYFFIIWFGLIGAALSTLLAVLIFYVFYYKIAQKYYFIELNFKKYTSLFILLFVMIVVGSYVTNHFVSFTANIFVKLAFVLLYGIVVYLKIIKKKDEEGIE
jgi:O-antigen/teichoic acid export membrane protein